MTEPLTIPASAPGEVDEPEMGPEDLGKAIEALRLRALFDGRENFPPQAEAYYLLALAALEQAKQFATLAHYAEMQAR